ncbi:MAG TPA: FHA domain-containing protein [Kofleriaceae bacterium]|nr:FHA domain-containing protein [Kofleriaceae bacterium]
MGDLRSRVIHLADGQDRADARNLRTGIIVGDEPIVPGGRFAELFRVAWTDLRRMLLSFTQPGIAVVAVDTIRQRVAGTLALAARVGRANAAIIGRHGHCDLYLHADPALALRHLVLVAHPISDTREVTYRLLDLRTRTAFADEAGKRLEALTASGPTFVRVGTYCLFLLPTGPDDAAGWPEEAAEAWKCVPERVYVEESEAEPDRWRRRKNRMQPATRGPLASGTGVVDPFDKARESVTMVRTSPGPSRATITGVHDEPMIGSIMLTAGGRSETLKVGASAVKTGVLVGRYERCDTHGASVLAHHGISRVHVLVLDIDGALYAIDTGSTNGIYLGRLGREKEEVRIAALAAGAELVLGDDLARMEWRPG